MKNYWSYFFGFLILFVACEENPFFGDDKIPNRSITGHVKLDKVEYYPEGYHGGVFVWAEGLGIKTTTDIDGSFELILPAANDPSMGAIVNGEYTIHFFLGNYRISKVMVEFAAGQIVADDNTITPEGELRKTISMTRLMGMHTTVSPEIITAGFDNNIKVEVDITSDPSEVFVYLKKISTRDGSIYTGLLIKEEGSNKLLHIVDLDGAIIMREDIMSPGKNLEIEFDYTSSNLPSGTYEVIPYLIVDRSDVPQGLKQAIGLGFDSFNQNYFQYPFKRTGGKLVIQ